MNDKILIAPTQTKERLGPEAETLIARIRARAHNLYQTRQLLCTEAVMVTLNESLNGGLSESKPSQWPLRFRPPWAKAAASAAP